MILMTIFLVITPSQHVCDTVCRLSRFRTLPGSSVSREAVGPLSSPSSLPFQIVFLCFE